MVRRYCISTMVLLLALLGGISQGFSVGKAIIRCANAATAQPKPVANSITITNTSGAAIVNYPFQFGRPFLQRAIPHAPQVLINGRPVTTQADVKNRYPDGSVEFAVIAVLVPSMPNNMPVTLSFADTTRKDETPLTQGQMLDPSYKFDAVMTLTPASGTARTASARQMLSDGNCKPWTSGQIAQTMICADDSAARKYDIGFGDGYHPFRPRFYATFWPATHQVYVRAVGENGLTTELEDLGYKLSISVGSASPTVVYTKDLTGATLQGIPPNSLFHVVDWALSRWTREFWIDGTPSAQVNIDNNLAYLETTRFLPNLDPAISVPATQIANGYNGYLAAPHDIYDGYWHHGVPWISAMGTAGDSAHIGPYPAWVMVWLHSPDWRARVMALNGADLAAAWPMNLRESDPTRRFQRSDAVGSGTGLGHTISAAGRPSAVLRAGEVGPDNLVKVGPIAAPRTGNPWTWDDAHQPSAWFPQYILTGDPWYLDELYAWAGVTVFGDAPADAACSLSCAYFRGPNGTYGGLWGYKAARAVAWTLRGRAEAAFAAPDGAPEKFYFTYMTNDAISKWEGGLGITGTPFDGNAEKVWAAKWGDPWTTNPHSPVSGQVPPLGNMASICDPGGSAPLCNYSAATQTAWGLKVGANGSLDDPWMNFYLEYAVGRTAELGFAVRPIQLQLGKLPIGIIASSQPWLLGVYTTGVEKTGGGWWPSWNDLIANGMDSTYVASLKTHWANGLQGGRQTWVTPGLAMLVDAGAPGATAAWNWYKTNAYSVTPAAYLARDPRWAIVPRTDANDLPPQPTAIP
jgi:hypothetical protein